jgi:hypothetical protein
MTVSDRNRNLPGDAGSSEKKAGTNPRVVIVLPTRNRANLASRAVTSVLRDAPSSLRIVLSDNSTDEDERGQLCGRLDDLSDPRISLLGPPKPLPMGAHWDWALNEALRLETAATHFSVLGDRTVFRHDGLSEVLDAVRRHPEHMVTYNHDRAYDHDRPVTLMLWPWSGALLWVSAPRLLALAGEARFPAALPVLSNCVVPRQVLETVRQAFGSICESLAPDYCFAFRSLTVAPGLHYYDATPVFDSALDRSNGAASTWSLPSRDHLDFLQNASSGPCWATPIPQLATVPNVISHEYCLVACHPAGRALPPLSKEGYLQLNAAYARLMREERSRLAAYALLRAHGWIDRPPPKGVGLREWRRVLRTESRLFGKLRRLHELTWESVMWRLGASWTKPFWLAAFRLFAVRPPHGSRFQFDSSEQAVNYLLKVRSRPTRRGAHLAPLLSTQDASQPENRA